MKALRLYLTCLVCLLFPSRLKPFLLRCLGHRVANGARIKASFVRVERLYMANGARIGRFNAITCRRLVMRKDAYFGTMNVVSGHLCIRLGPMAAIGNRNIIGGGAATGSNRCPQLTLDTWSKITASHYVNVGESIRIGEYSTLAGAGSQLWTHGYVHMSKGIDRAEVRGKIVIGDNVYIGSHSCVQAGVTIGDAVSIGSHASVATSLVEPGVYVPQPLRFVPRTPEERIGKLTRMTTEATGENFYWRDGGGGIQGRSAARSRDI